MLPFEIDFRNVDYTKIFKHRFAKLSDLRRQPSLLPDVFAYYRTHIAQFIIDWGMTCDPRNVERGLPTMIPFMLFPKQVEFVDWFIKAWKDQEFVLVEKSRDMGVTWLCVAIVASICLFNPGAAFGFGSRKEEYVDRQGDMDSILEKARAFLSGLPIEFRGGWNLKQWSREKLLTIPMTKSIIKGEAGDNIGRGGRLSGCVIDEAAHLERPELIEASLSNATNFRVDVSTPHGSSNPFAQKIHSGNYNKFRFHWTDDPRKDGEWYERMKRILDPVTLAQEVELDYSGSLEGILIPYEWVRSAVDAHIALGYEISGKRIGGLDIADGGKDKNAFAMRHGQTLTFLDSWTGVNSDILHSVEKAMSFSIQHECPEFYYDVEGVGAGAKGDVRAINEKFNLAQNIKGHPFRGSAGVWKPDRQSTGDIPNKDLFANMKAQAWWQLRVRFQNTFRAIKGEGKVKLSDTISIPKETKNLSRLLLEISQPTYSNNAAGKILINKAPKNTPSPNLADAVMIAFHDSNDSIVVSEKALQLFGKR